MDLKATALLKLCYLEMMGHDMSWASFHVLEVMSSAKYHQKRIGYLAAVQSFRPDTEVLMLATNLIKKDLASPSATTIILPITALPHVINPSLALSTLSDLIPRLTSSNPSIRKKTIVTLYRLALVYPETLRAAWPQIKDRLMSPDEDPSVTAAIVNVVCELGWRRPNDFLPLAPRLFELLVDGNNNWMAIKLIKLFATLTPLEPRLVRKLLPPLTDLIRTTPAMSLLYECINGIIQGGILGDSDDVSGREEIASLCVTKLRGMIMVDGDPNLKYVALLAFNKIVITHPFLVAQQEDVIMECIDSPDITIRVQALNLVKGMVSSDNLMSIVSRLMRQLKNSTPARPTAQRLETGSDEDVDAEVAINPHEREAEQAPPLPDDYRIEVIGRILAMCSQDNYSNLVDFEWYIDILTQLVRMAPVSRQVDDGLEQTATTTQLSAGDVSEKIGNELRSLAVKVKAIRPTAVNAAELILRQYGIESNSTQSVTSGALRPVAWIVGEYSDQLTSSEDSLGHLLQILPRAKYPDVLASCLQATIKIFAQVAGSDLDIWTSERKAKTSLLLARIVHVLEPLALHPNLEVQERAVEFTELLKLTSEAVCGQPTSTDEVQQDPPLLLTQAIPSLFIGWELNSVAPGAQINVPLPAGLDLDEPIHPNLNRLLSAADTITPGIEEEDEFEVYYYQRPPPTTISSTEPAINRLADAPEEIATSYQASEESYLDPDILARRKAERDERNKDDPFYIQAPASRTGTSTPIHNILQTENGPDLDIDSIPVMQLDLGKVESAGPTSNLSLRPKPRQRVVIAQDENLAGSGGSTPRNYDSENNSDALTKARAKKLKQSLLQVDSSNIGSLTLEGGGDSVNGSGYDYERQKQEEAEMAQAMKEVERLRLEMQRANERIQVAQGVDVEGTVIKKRKKKATRPKVEGEEGGEPVVTKVKKKKKQPAAVTGEADGENGEGLAAGAGEATVKPKKKKKPKPPVEIQESA
ncbi:Adaptor protein complex AP-3 delta subunit [Cryphonectria parasitica EP155]|uniref:AP-3 complex subunit delta n=1 Tax=Cryphonectria parasitica (strain ATCC 38755 / EP155) TaxID=660469 RepID=A0A9P4YDH4_CRYP1|nr:Adaptor protein complex AP-3 delta subunit [Cryphonectria parasitica EP155]KAF3771053.1 Adaptor protein complex AP-3 delta subunit [Cryphonectria parasitica EP155]